MKRVAFWIVGLAVFVAALWVGWTFRSNNAAPVDLDLIWVQIAGVEMWWLVLMTLLTGILASSLIFAFVWLRLRLLLGSSRSRVRRLEKEVHELRSLPLVGSEPGGAELELELSRGSSKSTASSSSRSRPPRSVAPAVERS